MDLNSFAVCKESVQRCSAVLRLLVYVDLVFIKGECIPARNILPFDGYQIDISQ